MPKCDFNKVAYANLDFPSKYSYRKEQSCFVNFRQLKLLFDNFWWL